MDCGLRLPEGRGVCGSRLAPAVGQPGGPACAPAGARWAVGLEQDSSDATLGLCVRLLFHSSCRSLFQRPSGDFRASTFCSALLMRYNTGYLVTSGRIGRRAAAGRESRARVGGGAGWDGSRSRLPRGRTLWMNAAAHLPTFPVPATGSLHIPACRH